MGANTLSVINQMLKDLDKRQRESVASHTNKANTAFNHSAAMKPWLLILITVIITLLLVYGVYLYKQNQQLIKQQAVNSTVASNEKTLTKKPALSGGNNAVNKKNSIKAKGNIPPQKTSTVASKALAHNPIIKSTEHSAIREKLSTSANDTITKNSTVAKRVKKTKIISAPKIATTHNKPIKKQLTNVVLSHRQNNVLTNKQNPSISVSRRQITSKQLAVQKMTQAEHALANNKITRAEKLYEEVLMLEPENKVARKQLAALWFGRKAYQEAINILAQGIALEPQYSEYRLMQARIYLTQGQNERAYKILQGLQVIDNIEYLATQASVAQQLSQYQQAIKNYQQLAKVQPNEGRWWLGLAVAYDANKQYTLALQAYQSAQMQGNLSANSLNFVQQRMQELRE